jgi:hypothetical protein
MPCSMGIAIARNGIRVGTQKRAASQSLIVRYPDPGRGVGEFETSSKHLASKFVKGHENHKRILAQRRCLAYAPARAR